MMLRKLLLPVTLLLAGFLSSGATAANCPSFTYGMVPTAAQWNACFDSKQNLLGYTPVNKAGDVMFGPLGTLASSGAYSGFNIPQGTAPTNPVDGDIWTTTEGIYARINGSTVGPFGTSSVQTNVPNTWTALQTFNNSNIALLGSSTGKTTLASENTGASNFVITFPAQTDTVATIGAAQTLSNKTLVAPVIGAATATSINKVAITAPATNATLALANGSTLATNGAFSTILSSSGATNVTLPTTGTLATLAGAETLTNKSLTTPTISGGTITGITDLAIADGGTGAGTAANARTNLGLGGLAVKSAISVPGDIAATGTPSSTTFLRGDGIWTLVNSASWSNATTAVSTSYTVANADDGTTIAAGGNAFYGVSVGAASGYNPNFVIMIANTDTSRGKSISIDGYPSFILWPDQSFLLFNQGNAWQFNQPGRWALTASKSWNVNSTSGSDSSDGLGTGSGAFATIQHAVDVLQSQVDSRNHSLQIQLAAGTYNENVLLLGQSAFGNSSIVFSGNASSPNTVSWNATGANNTALAVRDFAIAIVNGIRFTGNSTGQTAMSASQFGVIDFSNIEFGPFSGGAHLSAATSGSINFNGGTYVINGVMTSHWNVQSGGSMNISNATINLPVVNAFSQFLFATLGSNFQVSGTTFTGAGSGSSSSGLKYNVKGNASVTLGGATLPGATAGTTASGGQVF